MSYTTFKKNTNASFLSDMMLIVLVFLALMVLVIYDIVFYLIPWAKAEPENAITLLSIIIIVGFIGYKSSKALIEYFGHGAGQWVLEVIREAKGTSETATRSRERVERVQVRPKNESAKVVNAEYKAEEPTMTDPPQYIKDAIDVLVKFGWKRDVATHTIANVLLKNQHIETASDLVRLAFAEVTK